ncbi:MAG: peptide chain release factor N(5)-glutamine methyltransferase [Spirochaetia bacterium]|nr:peptide chain release factor N(5)-glutamine methyltransferase [Spirochaetia bacterium]
MKNIKQILFESEKILKDNHIEKPRLESQILLSHILKLEKYQLITNEEYNLSFKEEKYFFKLIKNKITGMPTAYLIQKKEFYSNDFFVNKNVLIPRPETEELVEWIINSVNHKIKYKLLDIGSGSGCIGITLGLYCNIEYLEFLDICKKALKICKLNADKLIPLDKGIKIKYNNKNILKYKINNPKFNIIVSNPPYVTEEEYTTLTRTVKKFEPKKALLIKKPDDFYTKFFNIVYLLLESKGLFFLETNPILIKNQIKILKKIGFYDIKIKKDFSNKDRFIMAMV